MNCLRRISCCLLLLGAGQQSIAGSDPIAWSLNQAFPNPVVSGISYTVTYTLTNKLPVQLIKPLLIEKYASSNAEFTYSDSCSGLRLNPNQSCTVRINLNPLVIGSKFVQISIGGYDRNVVPLPMLLTNANSAITAGVVGTITQPLPNSMNTGSAANYAITFTNNSSIDATGVTTTITQTTGTPTTSAVCSGTLAKNGGTCLVQGTFTPTSNTPSSQSVLATINFSGASSSPVSAMTTTTVNNPSALIVGSIIVPYSLPPLMTPGQAANVQFLFSNVSGSTVNLTDTGTITCLDSNGANCTGQISAPVSQCTNGSLGPTQACSLTTTFTAPAAQNPPLTYTITGALAYTGLGTPATIATSGAVVSSLPTRTIKMVNHCGFTLSYSLNGAALPASAAPPSCPAGSTASGSTCWWNNYVGNSNILANNGVDYITVGAFSYQGIQWSGNISASTGCAQPGGGSCTQTTCNNSGGSTSCAVGQGFTQPATQAEITMLTNGVDSYDVEVINGFHIPISMEPYYVIDDLPATANGFSCGTPGSATAGNGFGSCDWNTASPPASTKYYNMVGGGSGTPCDSSACTAPEICGLSQPGGTGPISTPICGKFLGYWTPNQLCTQASSNLPASVATALNCNSPTGYNLSPADPFNNTYTSLMACPVAKNYTGPTYNSCYSNGYPQGSSVDQCCGCVNWWDPAQTIGGVNILANNSAQTCPAGQTNPLWKGAIQNGIQWMKQACPSVYVYPFDDATSKFTCTNNTPSGTNTTSYVITFCPGNITGLPTNTSEGRG